jgi:DNA-binding GntR family transcriptional regulator
MCELREILEAGAARLAAERGFSRRQLAEARRLTAAMRAMGDHAFNDVEHYLALDTQLHLLIASATGNRAVGSAVTQARQDVAAAFDAMVVPGERKTTSDDEHDALVDAIARKDAAAAEAAVRVHVNKTTGLLEAVLTGARRPRSQRSTKS